MIIFEQKWIRHYSNTNDFEKYICGYIGDLLLSLRRENNQRLSYLSRKVDVDMRILEENELGRRQFHWFALFRVLKLYGKTLEIKLVNAKYEEEAPETQENNLPK